MQPTGKIFTNIETGEKVELYMHSQRHTFALYHLGSTKTTAGSEVNGFYLTMASPLAIKLNNGQVIYLPAMHYYNLKEDEEVVRKKYEGMNTFIKA